jgi:hypothetical protein
MKKILVLILAVLLLAGCTTKNEEKKEEKEKVETTIKYNKNISSNKIEKCDYKPELLFEKEGIKIYSYCINDITYNKNKLSISKRGFKSFDFMEKTFIPVNSDLYLQLVEFKKENKYEPKIIYFEASQNLEQKNNKILDNPFKKK